MITLSIKNHTDYVNGENERENLLLFIHYNNILFFSLHRLDKFLIRSDCWGLELLLLQAGYMYQWLRDRSTRYISLTDLSRLLVGPYLCGVTRWQGGGGDGGIWWKPPPPLDSHSILFCSFQRVCPCISLKFCF